MALVHKSKYSGSVIGDVVIDALTNVGILDIINKQGYILGIFGVTKETEDGYLDDSPNNHVVVINKHLLLGNKKQMGNNTGFIRCNKINKQTDEYKESLNVLEEARLKAPLAIGIKNLDESEIVMDKAGDCYYSHSIKLVIKQNSSEDESEYVKRMFNIIADFIVQCKL